MCGHPHLERAVGDRPVQRLEVVAHDLVQRRELRPSPLVDELPGGPCRRRHGAAAPHAARQPPSPRLRWLVFVRSGGGRQLRIGGDRRSKHECEDQDQQLHSAGGYAGQEFRILRFDMTDRTTSFVVAIGKPYTKGGPGQVGDVWGGLLVRNSGVGFASLLMILHLTRLLCLNGMTAPLPDALLLRKRHRGFQETTLLNGLRVQAADLPDELGRGVERLLLSEGRHVDNVEAEVGSILRERRLPARLLPQVMQAYGREPTPSAFGISQALTFAAQSLAPEERLELEQAAGSYLAVLN